MAQATDQELTNYQSEGDDEINKIREQIDDTRSQMGETIDELQERLSIPALTAQIKEEVSEQITSVVETTKEVVYDTTIRKVNNIMNKLSGLGTTAGGVVPLLLIGVGTGLILMNRGSARKGVSRHNGSARTNDPRTNGSTENSTLGEVKDAAANAYHRVGDAVSSTAAKVSDLAASGKEGYVNYFDRNPMAVGAVAAAMGLAVGLALPLTETESELLGETAGSIRDRLESAAKDTVEKIKESSGDLLESIGKGEGEGARSTPAMS